MIFHHCFLLGFSFQPLLKDLASQQLCKIEAKNYGGMNQLFSGVADIDLIEEQWDQIMRVIASIKNGIAPAHVIINRLISRVSRIDWPRLLQPLEGSSKRFISFDSFQISLFVMKCMAKET